MLDLQSLCHTCGAALPAPSGDRHPRCADCAASRPAARRRLSARCSRNRRRAHRAGSGGSHFAADVRALHRRQRGRCAGCGAALGGVYASPPGYHVDHKIPLARGGGNAPGNLQLLCPDCNIHKGDR